MEWRILFKKFVGDLACCVDGCIRNSAGLLMTDLTQIKNNTLPIDVDAKLIGGRLDYPKLISKVSYSI